MAKAPRKGSSALEDDDDPLEIARGAAARGAGLATGHRALVTSPFSSQAYDNSMFPRCSAKVSAERVLGVLADACV